MFQRLCDCLCHPRYLGRYHKDKVGIILLTVLIFLSIYIAVFATSCYMEEPFSDYSYEAITSAVIQEEEMSVQYIKDEKRLVAEKPIVISKSSFSLFVMPENTPAFSSDIVNIVLLEKEGEVYYGGRHISTVSYDNLSISDFDFKSIQKNDISSIFNFKLFMQEILSSGRVYFQTSSFIRGIATAISYYLIIVVALCIYAMLLNPTIDRGVRVKLCFYDSCIFFIGATIACLFSVDWLIYFAFILPLLYGTITFRHIVRVVIKKEE